MIEVAPALGLPDKVRAALCDAAVRIAREIRYDNAGTIEFLVNADNPREWFFIERNPRIQVEHTVTEMVTGIDLVRSQILIAQGCALFEPELDLPRQEAMPRIGSAVQCRVTTEDPANKFTPDYGRILSYRSSAGLGIRLDGAMGDTGSVITPFYDSLLGPRRRAGHRGLQPRRSGGSCLAVLGHRRVLRPRGAWTCCAPAAMAIRLGIVIAAASELVAESLAAMGFGLQLGQPRAGQILHHPGRFAAIVNA